MNLRSSSPQAGRASWPWRDRPALVWLMVLAVVVIAHRNIAASRWLMVHLLVLGVASHSIIVWGQHFADALLRTPSPSSRTWLTRRLILLHSGIVMVAVAIPARWWWPALTGACLVGSAVAWHGLDLARQLRAALPTRFRFTVHYYLAASCCLPIGAGMGAALAFGLTRSSLHEAAHARFLVAHTSINMLGWVGLTVLGTLTTLWPTMLRTQLLPGVETLSRRALPVLGGAVLAVPLAAWWDVRALAVAGLGLYLVGTLMLGWALGRMALRKPPRHFSTLSAGAGLLWLIVGLAWALMRSITTTTWEELNNSYGALSSVFVVGFLAQVLFGALSYLLPTVLGGGPSVVRMGVARIGRWGVARVLVANLGLILCLLPVPSWVLVTCSLVVFAALGLFVPLAVHSIVAGIRHKRLLAASTQGPSEGGKEPSAQKKLSTTSSASRQRPWHQSLVAVLVVAAAGAVGVAIDPAAAGFNARPSTAIVPTGRTTTLTVQMEGMRFIPDTLVVPAGDRLVIELVNDDPGQVHDLLLQGGIDSGRLHPGQRATLDVGVINAPLQGWCSVAGHRQMGMTLQVLPDTGADDLAESVPSHHTHAPHSENESENPPPLPRGIHTLNQQRISTPTTRF